MKKSILYALLFLFITSIFCAQTTIEASLEAIYLWSSILLPSFLFPLILVSILSPYHLFIPFLKPFKKGIALLFQMDVYSFELILTSLFLGFPSASIYLEENIDFKPPKAYERFLYIPFMASPTFILLSLSKVYDNKSILTLFLIQILSIFILLIIKRKPFLHLPIKKENLSFSLQFSLSIQKSFSILTMILANLVLVYVCIAIFTLPFPTFIQIPFRILSEFASGCFFIQTLSFSHKIKMILTTLLLSYGGLCVHLQILSSLSKKFSYKQFLLTRLTHIFISFLLAILLF